MISRKRYRSMTGSKLAAEILEPKLPLTGLYGGNDFIGGASDNPFFPSPTSSSAYVSSFGSGQRDVQPDVQQARAAIAADEVESLTRSKNSTNRSSSEPPIKSRLPDLGRLQDLQVTIEVRFITLTDNFFERIGVDFDFQLQDKANLEPVVGGPSGTGLLDDEATQTFIGLDENGNYTADLDLTFNQQTFGASVPAFGGFEPVGASTFGFAILSDIEAFFIINATVGDARTNVQQAPKVTLFNGQNAFVSDAAQRPFVTSLIPVVG